jgi:hypothetical protein
LDFGGLGQAHGTSERHDEKGVGIHWKKTFGFIRVCLLFGNESGLVWRMKMGFGRA